jgi:hypothetical protein
MKLPKGYDQYQVTEAGTIQKLPQSWIADSGIEITTPLRDVVPFTKGGAVEYVALADNNGVVSHIPVSSL